MHFIVLFVMMKNQMIGMFWHNYFDLPGFALLSVIFWWKNRKIKSVKFRKNSKRKWMLFKSKANYRDSEVSLVKGLCSLVCKPRTCVFVLIEEKLLK